MYGEVFDTPSEYHAATMWNYLGSRILSQRLPVKHWLLACCSVADGDGWSVARMERNAELQELFKTVGERTTASRRIRSHIEWNCDREQAHKRMVRGNCRLQAAIRLKNSAGLIQATSRSFLDRVLLNSTVIHLIKIQSLVRMKIQKRNVKVFLSAVQIMQCHALRECLTELYSKVRTE